MQLQEIRVTENLTVVQQKVFGTITSQEQLCNSIC